MWVGTKLCSFKTLLSPKLWGEKMSEKERGTIRLPACAVVAQNGKTLCCISGLTYIKSVICSLTMFLVNKVLFIYDLLIRPAANLWYWTNYSRSYMILDTVSFSLLRWRIHLTFYRFLVLLRKLNNLFS